MAVTDILVSDQPPNGTAAKFKKIQIYIKTAAAGDTDKTEV